MSDGVGSDRFIVITDGSPLMNVLYLWADRIPEDWQPVRPGADRRIACEVPVDFGIENVETTSDEQSVLTRGYASVLVNNTIPNEEIVKLAPGLSRTLLNLLLGPEGTAASGLARVDWDPQTRTCKTVWENPDVSIPNAVPSMSSATNQIYGISNRSGVWGLQGVDFDTGEVSFFSPASAEFTENSFFAMTTVGPDDTVWTGTPFGVTIYRSKNAKPAPELGCVDVTPPTIKRRGRRYVVRDRACGRRAPRPRVKRTKRRIVAVDAGANRTVRRRARPAATQRR